MRRMVSIFLLLVFLPGSTGFCLTAHFCSHSGLTYFSSWGKVQHDCEEDRPAAPDACCLPKKQVAVQQNTRSCCAAPQQQEVSTEQEATAPAHSCCSDQKTYHKLDHILPAAPAFTPVVLSFDLPLPLFNTEAISAGGHTAVHSPPHDPPPDPGLIHRICTYRI